MDDILGMPPDLHQREGHPALHLVVDSAHKGIGSKQHQRVAMGGVHQPADLFCQTLCLHFAAHWRFRQVPRNVEDAVFLVVEGGLRNEILQPLA